MAKLRRKRRTREHVIADLSVHHVEGHVLRCGWVVERMAHDYGIDLELVTFNRAGEVESASILLQLKATSRLHVSSDAVVFPFRVERRDLIRWLAEPFPVILIVYDARQDVAYWVYIQSYFRRLRGFSLFTAGKTVTIPLPLANIVSPVAVRQFARFRDRVAAQLREVSHDEDENGPLR